MPSAKEAAAIVLALPGRDNVDAELAIFEQALTDSAAAYQAKIRRRALLASFFFLLLAARPRLTYLAHLLAVGRRPTDFR